MKTFLIEIIFATAASIICILYILFPNPHLMAIFVFIAQPMFGYVIISTALVIFKELRRNRVI